MSAKCPRSLLKDTLNPPSHGQCIKTNCLKLLLSEQRQSYSSTDDKTQKLSLESSAECNKHNG